jgi:ABC-type transporter Mla subunit MlaD
MCSYANDASHLTDSKSKMVLFNDVSIYPTLISHNSLFGDLASGSGSGREGMHVGNLLTQLTTFIHQQHQQIQALIDEIRKNVKQINDQMQS